ncbi:hypothetical protein NDU88_002911 [Pleurodeles waltl]|uniref:Uncharacterized protein n=1 Tax=Pleurodeles waltl TaxID=8319 RepID=A0AAV7MRY1_PLEWA|nr:hypothetical protein NDU88_002911 [Pleurodeles waltl]
MCPCIRLSTYTDPLHKHDNNIESSLVTCPLETTGSQASGRETETCPTTNNFESTHKTAQECMSKPVQLVDKRHMKKKAIAELQVGNHTMRFVIISRATCNIMCVPEYEKLKHKLPLSPSNVDVFTWMCKPVEGPTPWVSPLWPC